jgi:hypothetical protein
MLSYGDLKYSKNPPIRKSYIKLLIPKSWIDDCGIRLPLTLHFSTLYLDKNPNLMFPLDERMYLLQVIKFS